MEVKNSASDDGDCDSYKDGNDLKLSNYRKDTLINLTNENGKIGYIKGVLLKVENILKGLKTHEALKVLEFKDKEAEEEIKNFYLQVLAKESHQDNAFYITELFIEEEHRGNGIGRKIFNKLPQYLYNYINKDISCIYLMPGPLEKIDGQVKYVMNPKDEQMIVLKNRLIKFYKSLGFERIGKTEFYYKDQAI